MWRRSSFYSSPDLRLKLRVAIMAAVSLRQTPRRATISSGEGRPSS
jgi:hypothetical protein